MRLATAFYQESRWDIFFYCVFIFYFLLNFVPFHFILLYSFLFCSFSPEQPQKKSELKNALSDLDCMDDAENLDIQADSGQLTADKRNVAQGSLEPVGATTEQLKVEEKTVRQAGKEAPDGDTQEEDSKQAAEEGSTQENVLKQKKKKTEVS